MAVHGRDEELYTRFERLVEVPMMVLSLAFVPIVLAPMVADLGDEAIQLLEFASWLIWGAFVIEYTVLLYLAPNRWLMVRTHKLDLFIILLPFLRPLRAARGLRLLRAAGGVSRAFVGLRRVSARRGFRGFLLAAGAIIMIGGLIGYAFERQSTDSNITTVSDALWWAIVTATTVGYGDFFPVTPEGRVIALLLMFVGIGLFSAITANVAAYFVESDERNENDEIMERLERIEKLLEVKAPSVVVDADELSVMMPADESAEAAESTRRQSVERAGLPTQR